MANDIQNAQTSNTVVKNGTAIVTCSRTGKYSKLDTYVQNEPTMASIENKYDNRFYNGIFVTLVGAIDGGTA